MAQRAKTRGHSEGGAALGRRVPRDLGPPSAYQSQGELGHPHSPASVPIRPAPRTGEGDPSIPDILLLLLSKYIPWF